MFMNDVAIISDEGQIIKYSELKEHLKDIVSEINKRSLIGIVSSNTVGGLLGYVSFLYHRHVAFMLPENINVETLENYIKKYVFGYLWVPSSWIKEIENNGVNIYKKLYERYDYCLLKIAESSPEMNPELALLISTSGTTGSEKVVRQSYRNIYKNALSIISYLNIEETDRVITSLPMSYTYGLSIINTHLLSRATILLTKRKPYDLAFWNFFKTNNGSSFSAVPYIYEMIRKLGISFKDIMGLRKMTVAGGALSKKDEMFYANFAEKYNKEFVVMYGQTEATARISYRPAKQLKNKIGSIGIAIPDGQMWLENELGEIINEPYKEGEIVYKGENVAMGYAYSHKDLPCGYDWGNVLHTGDSGYVDEDGYFYVTKRNDKSIKLNGHRVDLADMEEKLRHKYRECKFVCSIEKCLDSSNSKRIRIEVECRKEMGYDKSQEIIDFLSLLTGFNRKIFVVDTMYNYG